VKVVPVAVEVAGWESVSVTPEGTALTNVAWLMPVPLIWYVVSMPAVEAMPLTVEDPAVVFPTSVVELVVTMYCLFSASH
jgi:hypothetical protein